jgi:hypothetical protein
MIRNGDNEQFMYEKQLEVKYKGNEEWPWLSRNT